MTAPVPGVVIDIWLRVVFMIEQRQRRICRHHMWAPAEERLSQGSAFVTAE
jgi:hypothetical protein